MPALEPVDIPETLKCYPYFLDWLKELGRLPEDVANFALRGEIQEVPSETQWKKFEPTDYYVARMAFKDGGHVERREKWSEGKMRYSPETEPA